jgi:hypothetical protein
VVRFEPHHYRRGDWLYLMRSSFSPYAAHRIYLFRDEYIFDLERAVVIETPQLGKATYAFSQPRSMTSFLALYTRASKDDIRRNRENTAERLGLLGRVIQATTRNTG